MNTPGLGERSPMDPKAPQRRRVDEILAYLTGGMFLRKPSLTGGVSLRKAATELDLAKVPIGSRGRSTPSSLALITDVDRLSNEGF